MEIAARDAVGYYSHRAVRERILEYCGARDGDPPTCTFVSQLSPGGYSTWAQTDQVTPAGLDALFRYGWDISRSLQDEAAMVVHFEIDYENPEAPAEALLRPGHAFLQIEPVYRAIVDELKRLNLPLLDVMTGRGYHFIGRVPLADSVVPRIARLSPHEPPTDGSHTGLGMVLEHFAQQIIGRASESSPIPIVMNGTEVGRGGIAREATSLDLSQYGDPIRVRQLRVAFGTYQSHRVRPDIFGERSRALVPVLAAVPRRRRSLVWMLEHARRADQAAAIARTEHATVPIVIAGLHNLVTEYETSSLAAFHRAFYETAPHPPEEWARTYDGLDPRTLPPCVGDALVHPNDALLKPTVLQHLTRALVAAGWHPRHVAGLVWSKYGRDFGWGDRWQELDAQKRAEFDVRVFAGLLATGLDEAIDFNCVSTQEKGLCRGTGCGHDLRDDRERLLEATG